MGLTSDPSRDQIKGLTNPTPNNGCANLLLVGAKAFKALLDAADPALTAKFILALNSIRVVNIRLVLENGLTSYSDLDL